MFKMFSKLAVAVAIVFSLTGTAQASGCIFKCSPGAVRITRADMDTVVFAIENAKIPWTQTVNEKPDFSNHHSNVTEFLSTGAVASVRLRFVREEAGGLQVQVTVAHRNPTTGASNMDWYVLENGTCARTTGAFAKCDAMEDREWKSVFGVAVVFAKKHGATF